MTDLKVLFVSPIFRIDPYLRRLSGLIVRMAKLVNEVKVITTTIRAREIPDRIEVIRVPSLKMIKEAFWPIPRFKKLLKAVK